MPNTPEPDRAKIVELAELLTRSQRLREEAARLLLVANALSPLIEEAQKSSTEIERKRRAESE